MKKIIILISIVTIAIQSFAQKAEHPKVETSISKDVFIKSVTSTANYTEIIFVYFNTGNSRYVYLNPPGHSDAYYIKANGVKYKLLSTQNIGQSNNSGTIAHTHECFQFSARFNKIPTNTEKFDLFEGVNGGWNFFGVQLDTPEPEINRFRRDYSYMTPMKNGVWEAVIKTDTKFVFNATEENDVFIYFESGKKSILSIVGVINEDAVNGYDFQSVKALDEEGAEMDLKIFNDLKNGVYMIFSKGNLIQFHN